ncbi:MAG: carotenoid 1,2-hydratase [Proteobacteria bacterium]|nr:carotenoid 1,2-hydratase [Pseudomonadota bacterium]
MSDDGRFGTTIIAFIGSVFSPYYAFRRRKGAELANPYEHVAINVALYGADGYHWAMTERGSSTLSRGRHSLAVGPSSLSWQDDGSLVLDIDEISVPWCRRIRGRLRVMPQATGNTAFALDERGRHIWQPLAPRAQIEADWVGRPSWTGLAYVDHNRGEEPLEAAFRSWSWSRTAEPERTRIFYDTAPIRGRPARLHVEFRDEGEPSAIRAPELQRCGTSFWRLPIEVRSDPGSEPRVAERWEDGPFYARSLVAHQLGGETVHSVHETVSLDRFSHPIVQAMLPFKMPRRRRFG